MERCPTTNPLKWCEICRRMTNHETRECYCYPRGYNDARNKQPTTRANLNVMERARPVLGTQPPLPRTTEVRYVEREMEAPCNDIVLATPYSIEEPPMGYEYLGDSNPSQSFILMDAKRGNQVDAYTKKGPKLSGALGPCSRCHGDHWVRDCPIEKLENYLGLEYHIAMRVVG